MKIAILTMFKGLSTTYSLVNVVAQQLEMLLDHGMEVQCLVCEGCERTPGIYSDPRIEWIEITNHLESEEIIWRDYKEPLGEVHESFYKEADAIKEDFVRTLRDSQVCIMHDILFQGWHYIHNIAIRLAQKELTDTKFVEFTHSFPYKRPHAIKKAMLGRYMGMPNTTFVYPTYSGISALARQYQVPEGSCKVVYNSLDLLQGVNDSVKHLHSKINLLETEILAIYPCRLTPSKRLEKVAMLAGRIKATKERSIKIIYCDFSSQDIEPEQYKNKIREQGITCGLSEEDMIFTSDQGFEGGFPREGVLDLFLLSNLFICPSFSESFGLTVLEAGSRGNLLVLNEKVPALEELGGKLGAYYMGWDAKRFEGNYTMHYPDSEIAYYDEHADKIVTKLLQDPALLAKTQVRRFYSLEWIWKNQLAPLIGV